jgi:hypothetical protein
VARFYIVGAIARDLMREAASACRDILGNTRHLSTENLRRFLLEVVDSCDINLGINDWKVAGTLLGRITIEEVEAWA